MKRTKLNKANKTIKIITTMNNRQNIIVTNKDGKWTLKSSTSARSRPTNKGMSVNEVKEIISKFSKLK